MPWHGLGRGQQHVLLSSLLLKDLKGQRRTALGSLSDRPTVAVRNKHLDREHTKQLAREGHVLAREEGSVLSPRAGPRCRLRLPPLPHPLLLQLGENNGPFFLNRADGRVERGDKFEGPALCTECSKQGAPLLLL